LEEDKGVGVCGSFPLLRPYKFLLPFSLLFFEDTPGSFSSFQDGERRKESFSLFLRGNLLAYVRTGGKEKRMTPFFLFRQPLFVPRVTHLPPGPSEEERRRAFFLSPRPPRFSKREEILFILLF